MKIGIVLPNQPAYSETFFNTKIKGLESHGYKVILFVNSKSSSCNYNTIKVAPNLSKGKLVNLGTSCKYLLQSVFFSFSATKKLYILNRKDKLSTINNIKNIIINGHILLEKVDWLHFGFGTMALARENVAQAIGAQMAVSFRGFDHYVFPIKNRNCYKKLFEKNVKYHVLSDEMKNDLLKLGIDTNKIFKITPAININFFQFEQKEKNEKSNCFQILTISRLHWIKGLNSILEALQIVKSKGINFHFTIIGDGNEKERLQFETYQLGLTENVTFVGKLNPIEIKNQLQNSDLYLQYSHQEGFCNSVKIQMFFASPFHSSYLTYFEKYNSISTTCISEVTIKYITISYFNSLVIIVRIDVKKGSPLYISIYICFDNCRTRA